ncbi:serine/threonine-protein kinase [Acrocarpospora sp. B8E8]|uniref:serine/threonine protein kinase n=1 Tax=Acrocarpospora sp. B8E8 TaxID=3153572 RepID=UPI00325D9EAA
MPERIGDYSLTSVLAEDDHSTVYAATSPAGARVAITLFKTRLRDPDEFLTRIENLQSGPAYHSASIVDAGTSGGMPYVVSEFVEGPSLSAHVAEHGPLTGAALHRLAIATMTALVPVHQAGDAHGALRPAAVLLGPDGPRVTGAGLARAVDESAKDEEWVRAYTTQRVRSPAFEAPEQFRGEPAGQAADMFSWAAMMAFAATGRSPFEGGSPSATMNQVLHGEPDLSGLPEPPRDVVADCLAKEPGARPTASQALMRLVGHAPLTIERDDIPTPPPAPAPPPPKQPRRFGLLIGAAAVAIVVLAGGGGHVIARSTTPVTTRVASAATAPGLSTVSASAEPTPPPEPTSRVKVPGVDMTLLEHPSDVTTLTAYRKGEDTYVRNGPLGEFTKLPIKNGEPVLSPDGRTLAVFTPAAVAFTGDRPFTVSLEPYGTTERPTWSRDGKQLLLTALSDGKPSGFVLIDMATQRATLVDTDDETTGGEVGYAWLPDGTGVAVGYQPERDGKTGHGVRFRGLDGAERKGMHWVGEMYGRRMFAPSGRHFVTYCPSGGTFCVWDSATGVRLASIGIFYEDGFLSGWYDDAHLIVADPREKTHKIVAMDLRGRSPRVLAEISAKDDTDDLLLYYTRS